jgi:hypothetical protein
MVFYKMMGSGEYITGFGEFIYDFVTHLYQRNYIIKVTTNRKRLFLESE